MICGYLYSHIILKVKFGYSCVSFCILQSLFRLHIPLFILTPGMHPRLKRGRVCMPDAKTTNSPRRPPKLLNRLGVVRQVSHCGKPQRTASSKKPLGFSNSVKLASGPAPLDPLAKAFRLCTPSPPSFRDKRKTSTGCSSLSRQSSKGAALASRQGAYPFGIPVVDFFYERSITFFCRCVSTRNHLERVSAPCNGPPKGAHTTHGGISVRTEKISVKDFMDFHPPQS